MKTQIEIKDGVFTVEGNNEELLRKIIFLIDEHGGAQIVDYDGPKLDTEVVSKFCSKCDAYKPLDQFYAHKGGHLGRRPECIECTKAADAVRRQRKIRSLTS